MKIVVRNALYLKRDRYSFPIPEFNIYEGEQVPTYKWSVPGTICLTTGDPRWPVREIHPDAIVSIDDAPTVSKPKADAPKVYVVQGSKGSTYTVTSGPSGLSCDCPGFQFRKSCKHLALAA
jgi:SWIM zinc finger